MSFCQFLFFRYFLFVLIHLVFDEILVKSDDSLCQNPVVYSADRFNNNTVRLFRDNDYWDLNGFPDNTIIGPKGSMKDYEFFNPINKSARIVTVLEGADIVRDRTFKFGGLFWWSWYIHPEFGLRYVATSVGLYWDEIPKDHGFDVVFHNGDKNDPMLVGLEADPKYSDKHMKIHYFSTKSETFVRISSDYFDEKDFPIYITDAFSWPTKDSKYLIYILKDDKHCTVTDKQKCSEWKPNQKLFGCKDTPTTPPSDGEPGPNPPNPNPSEGPDATDEPITGASKPPSDQTSDKPPGGEGGVEGTNGDIETTFSYIAVILPLICFLFI